MARSPASSTGRREGACHVIRGGGCPDFASLVPLERGSSGVLTRAGDAFSGQVGDYWALSAKVERLPRRGSQDRDRQGRTSCVPRGVLIKVTEKR